MCGRQRTSRGIALVLVILVLLLLLVISTGFVAFTTQGVKTGDASLDATTCYYLAEAGLDYGIYLIKHNLSVYPISSGQNSSYSLPGKAINLTYDYTQNTSIVDASNTSGTNAALDQARYEHIVISNLSYSNSTLNWMNANTNCGTFAVKIDSTKSDFVSNPATIVLQSTGYIRQMPSNLSSSNLLGVSITNRTWPIKAQRTLGMTLQMNHTTGSVGVSRGYMNVEKFYEKFR